MLFEAAAQYIVEVSYWFAGCFHAILVYRILSFTYFMDIIDVSVYKQVVQVKHASSGLNLVLRA